MMTKSKQNVFSTELIGSTLVVTPLGDAIGFRYNQIHTETNGLTELLDKHNVENLIIDFGAVEIVGSIIISSIVRLARKITGRHGKAAFCNASSTMQDVVQTMNLTRLWPYYDSREAAIAAFASSEL
jgi:anti-anti-sigma regulatory factor